MQVQCIAPFGESKPGDVIEVPDGSTVCPLWFATVDAAAQEDPITPPVSS